MDLAALRGNRLEALKGDRAGQHSIGSGGYASAGNTTGRTTLEIVDYH